MLKKLVLSAVIVVMSGSIAIAAAKKEKEPDTYEMLNLFGEVMERAKATYVEDVTDQKLIESAINGMLTSLDPHSSYLDNKSFAYMNEQTKGKFGGLGIEVTMDNGLVLVISPIDDTPAAKAGIKAGDYITHIDGETVIGLNLNEAVSKMRGKIGTKIKLSIRRANTKPFDVTLKREEIEPNNSLEYSQYIDCNTLISGNIDNYNDIDFYQINPTNGFVMDFSMSVYNLEASISMNIISTNNDTIFSINSEDISNYKGFIELKDILLNDDAYYLKLNADKECKYNLKFIFNDNYMPSNEAEPNNTIYEADIINYPNEMVYGYFIKSYFNLDEYIKQYIKQSGLIDVDFYEIKNDTDISTSINIKLEYPKYIDIILFDENYNYLKQAINQLNISFEPNKKYYIALVCYGDKYITDRYTLHYEFN